MAESITITSQPADTKNRLLSFLDEKLKPKPLPGLFRSFDQCSLHKSEYDIKDWT